MQIPTAEQAQRFIQSIGYVQDAVDKGVWTSRDGRGVPYRFELDTERGVERSIRDIVLLHDLDPFVVRCRMLGFEPLTEHHLTLLQVMVDCCITDEYDEDVMRHDLLTRTIAHLRATGTVHP